MEWISERGYRVSDDASEVDRGLVHRWLTEESYWAQGRALETVNRSIDNSLVFSLFDPHGAQVGFCRMVTDTATFAWLCDVFVDSSARGHGSGKFLVQTAVTHPAVRGLRQVLGTKDAHTLYEQFGYQRFDAAQLERWMLKPAE
jgi:GNAT superfamily N-acetyltransferase